MCAICKIKIILHTDTIIFPTKFGSKINVFGHGKHQEYTYVFMLQLKPIYNY